MTPTFSSAPCWVLECGGSSRTTRKRHCSCVPDLALREAEEHLGALVTKRGGDRAKALRSLSAMARLVDWVSVEFYGDFEQDARRRLGTRDPDDWPILAAALALDCPIWTEDADFFGCGVATWTSSRVEIFFERFPRRA